MSAPLQTNSSAPQPSAPIITGTTAHAEQHQVPYSANQAKCRPPGTTRYLLNNQLSEVAQVVNFFNKATVPLSVPVTSGQIRALLPLSAVRVVNLYLGQIASDALRVHAWPVPTLQQVF